jgi:hypothetical protein
MRYYRSATGVAHPSLELTRMSHSQEPRKEKKKQPHKTAKEKKQTKREKKTG